MKLLLASGLGAAWMLFAMISFFDYINEINDWRPTCFIAVILLACNILFILSYS